MKSTKFMSEVHYGQNRRFGIFPYQSYPIARYTFAKMADRLKAKIARVQARL